MNANKKLATEAATIASNNPPTAYGNHPLNDRHNELFT